MKSGLGLLLLAACGRLGFDPGRSGDGGGSGSNGDGRGGMIDADNAVGTDGGAHAEICNGVDDNLDGIIDEACPCTPFSIALTSDIMPQLVWVGDHYDAVVETFGTATVHPIANDGTYGVSLGPVPVFGATAPSATAWNGIRFAIATNNAGADAVMFDPQTGNYVENTLEAADDQAVVRRGDHFAYVIRSGTTYKVREVSGNGTAVTDPPAVDVGDADLIGVAAGPAGYGIVTYDGFRYAITVLGLDGGVVRNHQTLVMDGAAFVTVTASAAGYAVAGKLNGVTVAFTDTTGAVLTTAAVPSTFGLPIVGTVIGATDRYHVLVGASVGQAINTSLFDYDFTGTKLAGEHSLVYSFTVDNYGGWSAYATSGRFAVAASYVSVTTGKMAIFQRCE